MPNLMRLSMCETRVVDLWTTTAALLKLPSLVELRFQNCLCCKDTGPCPASFGKKGNTAFEKLGLAQLNMGSLIEPLPFNAEDTLIQVSHADGLHSNLLSPPSALMINEVHTGSNEVSVASETDISSCLQNIGLLELSSNVLPNLNEKVKLQNEVTVLNA